MKPCWYGITGSNSFTNGAGAVFRITPSGTPTTLYTFCKQGPPCANGYWPDGLVQASDGNFYGITIWGGATGIQCQPNAQAGCGTIYKITPSGTLTALYTFCMQGPPCADGGLPIGRLVQGTDGNFYGVTFTGTNCTSPGPCGTIFKMTPSGALTTLHVFDYADGSEPRGLTQATDGNFYGTTFWGGTYGWGTIFRLSSGLAPFVKLVQPAGKIGQTIGIIGQGLTGTSNVSFNGTSTSFTVVSNNLIKATVPSGAITGFVTVQTPTRTLKSNVSFYVF